ncbi:4-hydroxythreonine-4-phosphate dehydrogenase PdxA [Roseivirga thermotolerans]|jgi:4-hydroxythreonine-4-phosphate dehydrogenase|uniref:4-hydroxythreonine-4-phosphate dehydrogenase n=1 Tax=Roseivirga thermotolerans TaxID=1758176 RepID=A0ABQ3I5L7_9BACT|nr:4-hydroxythreonine-4-phosphate dehydrogenase PdxA [Roseivirga thermotolerans]MEC7754164.1 4-hydroxythreonine-4-phosphate dehydrogenase PdxA [Bacteroidota bacterium]GHE60321.1 4-hydroxythreonine-4-phosphate dehydrogenase [Roseivirga thermotolerans]
MHEPKREERKLPTLGITIGDVNGIGPEVIIKSALDARIFNQVNLVVYGHGKVLSHYKTLLDIEKFVFNQTQKADQIRYNKLNVINCVEDIEVTPGEETKEAGALALAAIQQASQDLKEGKIDAIVTAPINKNNIQSDSFQFPGHTEFFTETFGAEESLMFLCSEQMRIGVATGHISVAQIKERLTAEVIEKKASLMLRSLKKDFGITKPKVAVLGLNPHAGEDGLLGTEENEIIRPVINAFKEKGELVFGPYPADGFFGNASQTKFDGVLAMYHDQGLIPFKTLAFEDGVNFTAGLSIVRTSPDHGTAYNIAGKGLANEQSMRAAIYMARDIWVNRMTQQS